MRGDVLWRALLDVKATADFRGRKSERIAQRFAYLTDAFRGTAAVEDPTKT